MDKNDKLGVVRGNVIITAKGDRLARVLGEKSTYKVDVELTEDLVSRYNAHTALVDALNETIDALEAQYDSHLRMAVNLQDVAKKAFASLKGAE